jgi:cardiolipin synthase
VADDTTRQPRVDDPQPAERVRLRGVPVFLWLLLGPEADGWALAVLAVSGRDRLPRRLPRPQARPDLRALGQILDPVADRLYILAVVIGLALRDIIPWWVAMILPLRDLLLWGLVPLLRTRGYSALPVHFLGKARRSTCSTRSRCCCSATARARSATLANVFGWAFALVGDRPLLVGRDPLRLAGPQAARDHRAGGPRFPMPEAADATTPRADREGRCTAHVTMPLLDVVTRSPSTRTTSTSPSGARPRGSRPGRPHRCERRGRRRRLRAAAGDRGGADLRRRRRARRRWPRALISQITSERRRSRSSRDA